MDKTYFIKIMPNNRILLRCNDSGELHYLNKVEEISTKIKELEEEAESES